MFHVNLAAALSPKRSFCKELLLQFLRRMINGRIMVIKSKQNEKMVHESLPGRAITELITFKPVIPPLPGADCSWLKTQRIA